MKITKQDIQLILILTILITSAFAIQNLYSQKAEYETNFDWGHHLTYYEGGITDNYPNIYWAFPISLEFSIYIHIFLVIPLLLLLLNYTFDKKNYKFNFVVSIFLYLITTTEVTFIDHGYFKQILLTEIFIIILFLRYKYGMKTYLLGIFLLVIQDLNRWIGNIKLLTLNFNTIGFYLLSRGQLLGMWGFILVPIAIIKTKQQDIKIIGIILFLMSLFETRIILTLFILTLPQISATINKKITQLIQ